MKGKLPKVGELVKRTPKGVEYGVANWADNVRVTRLDSTQAYVDKVGSSSIAISHFTIDGNMEIIGGKSLVATHIITWDTRDVDPFYVVYSNKEKIDKIKELLTNDDVMKDSIRVYQVKTSQKVEYSYKLKTVK